MNATAYYNEFDEYAAQWLRNLIAENLIPYGHVDTRSITDVEPSDLAGFRQCHFFAGIGGWALAARLAGWPDDRELWTGSAPCQPFSVAGKGKAQSDDRHLWPHLFRIASSRRPAVFMGEQVAAAVGKDWFDGVRADLEGIGYACRGAVVPACAVDAPHRRDRLWFVAHAAGEGWGQAGLSAAWHLQANDNRPRDWACDAGEARDRACAVADADQPGASEERAERGGQLGGAGGDSGARAGDVAHAASERSSDRDAGAVSGRAVAGRQTVELERCSSSAWSGAGWIIGHDGKARRVEPGIRLLAHGVSARVGRLRAYGNAIVPQVAAEVIGAFMDCMPANDNMPV